MSYRRKQEDKRRLNKLYSKTKSKYYGANVGYDNDKERYIRFYASNTTGHTKYLRKLSNKKVRKNNTLLDHNQYKKLFDYWWTLF